MLLFSPVLSAYGADKIEPNQESPEDIERRNALSILYSEESKNAVLSAGYTLGKRVVERGETWESIAAQYKVAVDLIKNLNSEYDECLAGIELFVPIASVGEKEIIEELPQRNIIDELQFARSYLSHEDYKKAVKEYDKMIKRNPSIDAYYERALAQYKRGKLKQAISDLQVVQGYDNYDAKYPDTDELLAGINEEWSAKKARRAELWGAIVGAVLVTGLEVGNAVIQSNKTSASSKSSYQSSSRSSTSRSSSSSFSDDDNTSRSKKKQKCGFCGGKGSIIEYTANYGIDERPWCDECGKKVTSGHYHRTCTHCNGTGER